MPKKPQMDRSKFAAKVLKASLDYAARGWRVHPLRPGTKVPVLNDWPTQASRDAEQIATWFGPGGEYEGHNVGIATGRESGLWVLDIDTGHGDGEDARQSMATLLAEHKQLPATWTITTPSGGTHLYFSWPNDAPDEDGSVPTWTNGGANALGPGLDVRAEGGQVAAYPSIVAGVGTYVRTIRNEPVRPPKWLSRLTRHVEPIRTGSVVPLSDLSIAQQSRAGRYAQTAIEGVLADLDALKANATTDPKAYTGAPWNDTTFSRACRLIELAAADWTPLTVDDARTLVYDHTPRDKGFTDRHVDTIFKSAVRSVGEKVAVLPDSVTMWEPAVMDAPARAGRAPSPPMSPDGFFDKNGLLTAELAASVLDEGPVGVGPAGEFWSYAAGVWRPNNDIVRARVVRRLGNRYRAGLVASVEDRVRHDADAVHLSDDIHPDHVNTRSGMVDWRTGLVLPHDPSWRSTVQLRAEWDPQAACPQFDRWLAEVVPEALQQRVWEVIGYMLIQGNPLQRAILLYGGGGNGKGTLIRTLQSIIGAANVASVSLVQMTEGKFEIAELYGKQANLAGDIEAHYLKDTAVFKKLTGGDLVTTSRKYQAQFQFVCHAVPLFSANTIPRSADTSRGYVRRWEMLPFERSVENTRRLDEDDLFAEANGIVARALVAVRAVIRDGEFARSVESEMAREQFVEASDIVSVWLHDDEDAVVIADPAADAKNAWHRGSHVYARFREWAKENGHANPLTSTRFHERMRSLGYERSGRVGITGYRGIRLRSDASGAIPWNAQQAGPEALHAPDEPIS